MQALLVLAELIDLLSMDYELNEINSRNTTLSFVWVPKTSSDWSFQNSKEWLDIAIKIAGSKHGGTYESVYRIANHLCRFYKDSVLAAYETHKVVVCKPMSATAFSSMMCAAWISGTGEQEMKKHLCAHLGPGFCPTHKTWSCSLKVMELCITTVSTSPLKVKRGLILLNGLRKA